MTKLSWPSIAIGVLGLVLGALLIHSLFLGPSPSRAVPPFQAVTPPHTAEESETTVVEGVTPLSQLPPTSSPQVLRGPDGQPIVD